MILCTCACVCVCVCVYTCVHACKHGCVHVYVWGGGLHGCVCVEMLYILVFTVLSEVESSASVQRKMWVPHMNSKQRHNISMYK